MDPAATRVAEALRAAGFAAPVALAAAAASDGDQWRALDDLCAALGPSREEALAAAREALAEAGAGDVDEEAATEILRTARVDELASLPREKHAPRGYTPAHSKALFQFEVPGIVQLGAKQYLAKLDVRLDGRDAYPFELPEMRFTHPTLQFPEAAAVNAAMHRAAAEMVGQPFLESLLEWCEGDDVADAVEKAREAMRASLAGANGDAGVATGGHLSRTFSKLELEAKAAEAEDARAAAGGNSSWRSTPEKPRAIRRRRRSRRPPRLSRRRSRRGRTARRGGLRIRRRVRRRIRRAGPPRTRPPQRSARRRRNVGARSRGSRPS